MYKSTFLSCEKKATGAIIASLNKAIKVRSLKKLLEK